MTKNKNGKGKDDDLKEEIVDLNTDEIVIEEAPLEETPIEKAYREAEESKNSFIRLQADFENFKKRNREQTTKMYSAGVTDAVTLIFPVLDSLELASKMYTDKDKAGVELIIKQFMTIFETLGVKEIDAQGKEFNPELHEAVARCEGENEEQSGKVAEIFRKGYIYSDKVLRASMVKIYE